MKLNQLIYFKSVARHGSITKAAETLHISQPAITRSIRDLEDELGVVLLSRTNKNVSLTNEGKLFLQKSTFILSQLNSLADEMRDLGELRRNSVCIGVPATIGTIILPRLNQIASEQFGLEAEIFEMSSDECEEAVENDELDFAVILLEDAFYPNIDYTILRRSSLSFCTNINHPLAKKDFVHIEDLAEERLIFYYPGDLMHMTFLKYGITPKYILRSNQVLTITKYKRANFASTLQFPEAFTGDPLICSVPLANPIPLSLSLVKKKGKRLFDGASHLYSFLAEHSEELIPAE